MKKHITTKKGFTLIELLVVISIIGLLSSVVFASVVSARVKGKIAYVQSQMRQYITALDIYKTDNDGYPLPAALWQDYCLGKGPCMWSNSNLSEDPALVASLNQYISGTPPVSTGIVAVDYGFNLVLTSQNAIYTCSTQKSNNKCSFASIKWTLPVINSPLACAPGRFNGQGVSGGQLCIYNLAD